LCGTCSMKGTEIVYEIWIENPENKLIEKIKLRLKCIGMLRENSKIIAAFN
jgi:hypothetical protein